MSVRHPTAKSYLVSIPVAGTLQIEVVAPTESLAQIAAWARYDTEGEHAGDLKLECAESLSPERVLDSVRVELLP